ncbi:hypothetical protein Bca101_010182 [Brassica carinata]
MEEAALVVDMVDTPAAVDDGSDGASCGLREAGMLLERLCKEPPSLVDICVGLTIDSVWYIGYTGGADFQLFEKILQHFASKKHNRFPLRVNEYTKSKVVALASATDDERRGGGWEVRRIGDMSLDVDISHSLRYSHQNFIGNQFIRNSVSDFSKSFDVESKVAIRNA